MMFFLMNVCVSELEISVRLYNLKLEAKKKGFNWLLEDNNEMVKSAAK